MKIKYFLYFILLISEGISFNSCKEQTTQVNVSSNQNIVINGKINPFNHFPLEPTISLRYFDIISGSQTIFTDSINENGEFTFSFFKGFAQDVRLDYHNGTLLLIVSPGDNINIEFDAHEFIVPGIYYKNGETTIKYSGGDTELNNEIAAFHLDQWFNQDEEEAQADLIKTREAIEFKDIIIERCNDLNLMLTDSIEQKSCSESFSKWAKYYVDYYFGTILYEYGRLRPSMKIDETEMPDDYFIINDRFKIDREEASVCTLYGAFLNEYRIHLIGRATKEMKESSIDMKDLDKTIDFMINYIIQNSKGFAKDILISQELYTPLKFERPEIFEKYYPIYKSNIISDKIRNILEARYETFKIGLE
ncbi:hypothetical protein ACFLSI_04920 [Bacteroidota bacterium]